MNFKRIEWIFIVAFILLDIFLLIAFKRSHTMLQSTTSSDTQNVSAAVLKSMDNDQIKYGKLSTSNDYGYYLSASVGNNLRKEARKLRYQTWSYSSKTHKLKGYFLTAIKVADKNKPQNTLNKLLENDTQILHGRHYRYNANLSTKTQVVYSQVLYGKQVYSGAGQIMFKINSKGYVISYTQGYLNNINILRENKRTISERRALVWLYQYNKLASGSTVRWGALGYSKLLTVNNNYVLIPTWTFSIKANSGADSQVRMVNAFTGTVITQTNN